MAERGFDSRGVPLIRFEFAGRTVELTADAVHRSLLAAGIVTLGPGFGDLPRPIYQSDPDKPGVEVWNATDDAEVVRSVREFIEDSDNGDQD